MSTEVEKKWINQLNKLHQSDMEELKKHYEDVIDQRDIAIIQLRQLLKDREQTIQDLKVGIVRADSIQESQEDILNVEQILRTKLCKKCKIKFIDGSHLEGECIYHPQRYSKSSLSWECCGERKEVVGCIRTIHQPLTSKQEQEDKDLMQWKLLQLSESFKSYSSFFEERKQVEHTPKTRHKKSPTEHRNPNGPKKVGKRDKNSQHSLTLD